MTSAVSAGGAAGASGVGLQNRVFAWAAAAMVAEQPPLASDLVAGIVSMVGAQTGFLVDDVALQTDAENYALFQVKSGLSLGRTEASPLSESIQQAVLQYLNGRLPISDGSERRVDPERDALVLCTDRLAPATVRVNLRTALARTASQPPGTPIGNGLTAPETISLNVALDHIRRIWNAAEHTLPTEEELRQFLRVLRVMTIAANDGEADHAAAATVLSTATPAASDASAAWPVLVAEGQAASVAREWRDRPAIGLALSRRGVLLAPPARYAGDIIKLRELSDSNLETLASDAVLPVPGGLYIHRGVSEVLTTAASEANVLIVGDAGSGKSAVAQEFVTARSETHDVVVLRATDVAGANRVPLAAPLTTVLRAWTGPAGVVLIDGVDALRGAEDREFLSATVGDLRGSRWQVVSTVRTFDARNNLQLQQAFAGTPLSEDPAYAVPRLATVRHLVVGDLSDAELESAVAPPLALASLLAEASPELRGLLRNPFNLRLATRLAATVPGHQHAELLAVRSRVGLLEAYWDWRVRNEDRTAREALLTRLCREMVTNRRLKILEAEPTVTAADSTAVQAMLSENVLTADDGSLPAARRVLSFSHNILFDYAAAVYLLLDPADSIRLVQTLDADPSLPLVARPSFEILVDILWEHRDEDAFWPLCLAIAGSSHVLASLAFAARVVNLMRARDNLAALAFESEQEHLPDQLSPSRRFAHQLIGALRTAAVLPDPTPAVAPLAALARRYAENTRESYADAALAADLLIGLQFRAPAAADTPDATDRGHAVAELLDGCRADPERMERLAGAAARQLPHLAAIASCGTR